jgi:hypothetical protein
VFAVVVPGAVSGPAGLHASSVRGAAQRYITERERRARSGKIESFRAGERMYSKLKKDIELSWLRWDLGWLM